MGRVAVLGAGGQLGTAFYRMLDRDAVGLTRDALDMARPSDIARVLEEIDPEAVINCAAYTHVDRAEVEEETATVINGEAVGALADWCAKWKRRLLTFSTDYVFNGKSKTPYVESSPTEPINAYGRSKLVGEELATARGALVVRTSWVISGSNPNFVATMIRLARERDLQVVDDQVGCPTIAADLAASSYEAFNAGVTGLLHLTNQGPTTWYHLARTAIEMAGLNPNVVTPCSTDDYPTVAKRPAFSVLASERLDDLEIGKPPPWESSLPQVVAEIMTWV